MAEDSTKPTRMTPEERNLKKSREEAAWTLLGDLWQERLAKAEVRQPEILYHYTDMHGLKGIVESQKLWATHIQFLNDGGELTYASGVFEPILAEIGKTHASNLHEADLLTRISRGFDPRASMNVFAFSLSEDNDDLGQWRGYGGGSGACALGLDFSAFIPPENLTLVPIIYDPEIQRELVLGLTEDAVKIFQELSTGLEDRFLDWLIIDFCSVYRKCAFDALLRFKSPHWQAEREWRLVTIVDKWWDPPDSLRFRAGRGGLIPYVEIKPYPMAGNHRGRIPLSRSYRAPHPIRKSPNWPSNRS